jgi:hypothetical protein
VQFERAEGDFEAFKRNYLRKYKIELPDDLEEKIGETPNEENYQQILDAKHPDEDWEELLFWLNEDTLTREFFHRLFRHFLARVMMIAPREKLRLVLYRLPLRDISSGLADETEDSIQKRIDDDPLRSKNFQPKFGKTLFRTHPDNPQLLDIKPQSKDNPQQRQLTAAKAAELLNKCNILRSPEKKRLMETVYTETLPEKFPTFSK